MDNKNTHLINLLTQDLDNGKSVSLDFDQSGNFYIDGKKIVTHEVVQLRRFELAILVITAAAVVVQSLMPVISYFYP